ncbi:MAG: hypothetical protein ACK40G_07725 [Cytophagaceae bacterium]
MSKIDFIKGYKAPSEAEINTAMDFDKLVNTYNYQQVLKLRNLKLIKAVSIGIALLASLIIVYLIVKGGNEQEHRNAIFPAADTISKHVNHSVDSVSFKDEQADDHPKPEVVNLETVKHSIKSEKKKQIKINSEVKQVEEQRGKDKVEVIPSMENTPEPKSAKNRKPIIIKKSSPEHDELEE